jgi:DNA-binding MarR family transcriptional regulator
MPIDVVIGAMDFFDALIRYETDLWNHVERRLRHAGATSLAVLEALRVIARHPGSARVADLQDELRISVGAASKLVDRLERDGLARRRPNPHDRRSSVLDLTETGRERHDDGIAILAREIDDHLAGFADEARDAVATLKALTDRLVAEVVR